MEEYLYKLTPKRQDFINQITPEEEEILQQHYKYLEKLLESEELILAGPCLDGTLGLVILRTSSHERAMKLMEGDPAVLNGIMDASLHPYRVSLMQQNSLHIDG
ncbi:YciI family protein [Pseudalkalibacillus sp. Hm43]|uniref:YciI family protein n=1 Tax=Pseudalkalibacillus sp. Hm43 TaxID=3450742 RepID=UPI003F42335F